MLRRVSSYLEERVDNFNRKIIHIISSLIIFLFPYFLTVREILFISLVFTVIFILARYLNFLTIINKVKRSSWGEVFYPLSIALLSLLFLPVNILAFQFGVLVLGISDAAANIFGELIPSYKFSFVKKKKSLAGFIAFTVSTFIILLFFKGFLGFNYLIIYLLISLVLSFSELILLLGLDNLFLPLIAAYLFSFL